MEKNLLKDKKIQNLIKEIEKHIKHQEKLINYHKKKIDKIIKDAQNKYILRQAFKDILPKKIFSNKIKSDENVVNDQIRAKKIGIIYQDKNLLSDFTALENVYLPNLLISNEKKKLVWKIKKVI